MSGRFRRTRHLLLGSALIVWTAGAGRPLAAQTVTPPTVCDCPDVTDLINRLNMVQATIDALRAARPDLPNDPIDQKGPNPKDPRTNQEMIRDLIKNAMGSVQVPGAPTAQAITEATCDAHPVHDPKSTQATTACMEEIVMWHETQVHVPACNASSKTAANRRTVMTLPPYVNEEMDGYVAEKQRILDILGRLPASCRQHGWVGNISYFEETKSESQQQMELGGMRVAGFESSTHTITRQVNILYRADEQSTLVPSLDDVFKHFKSTSIKAGCVPGKPADRVTTGTELTEATIVGRMFGAAIHPSFDYDDATGEFQLGFTSPELPTSKTVHEVQTASNLCDTTLNGTWGPADVVTAGTAAPFGVNINGTVAPGTNRNFVQGVYVKPLEMPPATPDLSITGRTSVSFTLFKLP